MRTLLTVFWQAVRQKPLFFWVFLPATVIQSALWIAEPLYGRYAIDAMISGVETGSSIPFLRLLGFWLGIYALINIAQAINFYLKWGIQHDLLARTRERYYDRLLRLDIQHHVRARGGELMKTIDNAADTTVDLSRQLLLDFLPSALTSLAFFFISITVSWQLALVMAVVAPIYIVITAFYVRITRKNIDKVNRLWVTSIGRGYDAITNIFTVKSSAGETREVDRMRAMHAEGIRELRRVNLLWATLEGVGYFMLVRILVIGIGMYLYIRGSISLGTVFFFQFSFFRTIVPLEMLGGILPRWNESIGKIRLAEDLSAKEVLVANADHPQVLPALQGHITLDAVSFSYGDADALHAVSLDIRPGEHIALVGHSGAGKSTLAMLLNRFYDVTDGRILIDGVDLRDLDVHWWRSQVGLVLQESVSFNDTVLENIRYGRPDATEEEVQDAARRAAAASFIEKFPDGYATLIGERGIRLSGGERQRIAIARAILKKPAIVVLDEATSALDSITEQFVQKGIAALTEGRTAVIIAHRLSTVRSVDRIAVLQEGTLLACAPHDELLQTCAVYRHMVELQSHGLLAA